MIERSARLPSVTGSPETGSAGVVPASGFGAEEEAFDGGFEVGCGFGVEAGGGGFEGVFEVVAGLAFFGVEDERVCADVERECEVAEGVEGGG